MKEGASHNLMRKRNTFDAQFWSSRESWEIERDEERIMEREWKKSCFVGFFFLAFGLLHLHVSFIYLKMGENRRVLNGRWACRDSVLTLPFFFSLFFLNENYILNFFFYFIWYFIFCVGFFLLLLFFLKSWFIWCLI